MFEKIIAENRYKSTLVIATYVAIFVLVGILADIVRINSSDFATAFISLITFRITPVVALSMLCISGLIVLFCVNNFSRIMLSGSEYKEIRQDRVMSRKEREIYSILERLKRKSKISFMPRLYIMEAPFMNAFASGWNEDNSLIALTTALIDKLDNSELEAVMAHELSHIIHGDVRLTMCVGILGNIMLFAINLMVYAFMDRNRSQGANTARWILIALQFVMPLLTILLQMYLSRSREYMADSGAAYIMGDSMPMIRALQKISGDYSQNNYSEVDTNPTRQAAYIFDVSESFSTHPSIQNRINSLLRRQ